MATETDSSGGFGGIIFIVLIFAFWNFDWLYVFSDKQHHYLTSYFHDSPKEKVYIKVSFDLDVDDNSVIAKETVSWADKEEYDLTKLKSCTIFDEDNWKCGKYIVKDGKFEYRYDSPLNYKVEKWKDVFKVQYAIGTF